MEELNPGVGYGSWELTFKDKFRNPYAGKVYPAEGQLTAENVREAAAAFAKGDFTKVRMTELVSMGMEELYLNPVKFAEQDREFFDFIIALLRGDL